jgi:soluble lytic murein transglycosylase-like protein
VRKIAGAAFAGFLLAASLSFASAQESSEFTILSAKDVSTYNAMFAAEVAGQTAKSNALAATLEDKVLLGYVLQSRYLGPHHKSLFSELSAWMKSYADLADAGRVYALARERAPKNASVTRPEPMRWRGARGEGDAFEDAQVASGAAERLQGRMGSQVRRGNPSAAHGLLKAAKNIPQADLDRLSAYAAFAYLVYAQDQQALAVAEQTIARNGAARAHARWTAGLASYRASQFERAAEHFSALAQDVGIAERTHSAAAFWAARSWMRAGKPEQVLPLYQQAAAERNNFYGLLAARLLGQDFGIELAEPQLDQTTFAELMRSGAAKRAVALWQVGRKDEVDEELQRAFGEIDPSLDQAYAALARQLGATSLELKAAELVAERDVRLTSLYPIPPYGPKGGYTVDQAVLLAFARQESRFQTAAVSRAGARGVMQIMPATAALVAGDRSLARRNRAQLYDPVFSMTLGQDHLRDLLDRQNGNLIALATAYNAGPGNLSRWTAIHEGTSDPLLFIESLPAAETRNYIKRVMVNLWMYRKRLGEPIDGLDDAAEGRWPVYVQAVGASQAQ